MHDTLDMHDARHDARHATTLDMPAMRVVSRLRGEGGISSRTGFCLSYFATFRTQCNILILFCSAHYLDCMSSKKIWRFVFSYRDLGFHCFEPDLFPHWFERFKPDKHFERLSGKDFMVCPATFLIWPNVCCLRFEIGQRLFLRTSKAVHSKRNENLRGSQKYMGWDSQ